MNKKQIAKLRGFERLNRPYLDKIDELFKHDTGRSFYDLLKEEIEKYTIHQQEVKK